MAENCKVYNLESFTDEERERVEALINQIEEEKRNKKDNEEERRFYSNGWNDFGFNITKRILSIDSTNFPQNIDELIFKLGLMSYRRIIETKENSRSKPSLKYDFNSKKLGKESLFKSAKDDVDNLVYNLSLIADKLQKREYITRNDWANCFRLFDNSLASGALFEVSKEGAE